jgi:methionyl-tRNA formyltransferase
MRIACVSYRKWAISIYDRLENETDDIYLIIRSKKQYDEDRILEFTPDVILFYGWSWFVSKPIIDSNVCIMLHPSPLPKYRGGSPLQNQILAGEKMSMVSLFLMTSELDAGNIIAQMEYSLEGKLEKILNEISDIGFELTLKHVISSTKISGVPQKNDEATYCKRRRPEESEISVDEIHTKTAEFLYNKIRMLADPYPNAFIRMKDGSKLIIKDADYEEGIR